MQRLEVKHFCEHFESILARQASIHDRKVRLPGTRISEGLPPIVGTHDLIPLGFKGLSVKPRGLATFVDTKDSDRHDRLLSHYRQISRSAEGSCLSKNTENLRVTHLTNAGIRHDLGNNGVPFDGER